MRIREHHPVCFGYDAVKAGESELSVFTFGRNLGRDLSPLTRDGNILVNTLAVNTDEISGYPYEYYGSRELFLEYERSFFLNAPDEPAPDLIPPRDITTGDAAPTEEQIEAFLSEEDRLSVLGRMLSALMQINDGRALRRIIVCDRKENIILWIAALSLVFPREAARQFTFRTYSFLGCNSDDFNAVYDDVMFCGAYTPTVNGDPESARATNYDLSNECRNESTALFDLEQGYIEEIDDKFPYFGIFIESAFSTDMHILKSYHDFIIRKTSYRSLGSDYAKGYGCYTILQLKNEHSLRYLPDAFDFAVKYTDPDTVRRLLDIAYSCTIDTGKESSAFSDILNASGECIKKGIVSEEPIRAHYISFLIRLMTCEDTEQLDYFRLKEQIKGLFDGTGRSFEEELLGAFTLEGIGQMTSNESSGWKYTELAECVSRVISSGSHLCGSE